MYNSPLFYFFNPVWRWHITKSCRARDKVVIFERAIFQFFDKSTFADVDLD